MNIKFPSESGSGTIPSCHQRAQYHLDVSTVGSKMANEACCKLPAVVTTGYKPKGTTMPLGSLQTCIVSHIQVSAGSLLTFSCADVTGNKETANKGIIDVYDIFGNAPQTLQGADMLAEGLDAVVLVPDFFKGDALPGDILPQDTEEKRQRVGQFLANQAAPLKNVEALLQTAAAAKKQWPSVKNWGAFGLCWGGKIAVLASAEGTPFTVSGTAHPGVLDKDDALKLTIPHLILASPGEPADTVSQYAEIFKSGEKIGEVETYQTMFHGWMGARADLQNPEFAKGFEQG
jgi:dienelactone hydrolase